MSESESLQDRLNNAHGLPWQLPMSVLGRLLLFVDDEPVEFADAGIDKSDDGLSGQAFVLTTSRAISATFTDAYDLSNSEMNDSRSSGDAQALIRTRLRSLSLPGGMDGRNPDRDWQRDYGDVWPHGAAIVLTYEGRANAVTLPLAKDPPRSQRALLRGVVPSLLADLA